MASPASSVKRSRAPSGPSAVQGRPQACLPGPAPGSVPGGPRQPDAGHCRRTGRCRHTRSRRSVGRGVLAHGQHAHQQGTRPVQRSPAHPTIWRTWRVARKIQETEDVVTLVIKERTDERDVKPSLPGQYNLTMKMQMPDGVHHPPVQPHRRSRRRAAPAVRRRTGSGPQERPTARSTTSSTTPWTSEPRSFSPHRLVTWYWNTATAPWCSPAPESASHLWRACSSIWQKRVHSAKCCSSAPTTAADRCAGLIRRTWRNWRTGPWSPGSWPGRTRRKRAAGSPDIRTGFMDVRDLDLPDDAEYYLCGPVVWCSPLPALRCSSRSRRSAQGHPVRSLRAGPVSLASTQ